MGEPSQGRETGLYSMGIVLLSVDPAGQGVAIVLLSVDPAAQGLRAAVGGTLLDKGLRRNVDVQVDVRVDVQVDAQGWWQPRQPLRGRCRLGMGMEFRCGRARGTEETAMRWFETTA